MNPVNIKNLAVVQGDSAVSAVLPLALPMICSVGSTNVFVNKRPVFSSTDMIIPSVPVIPIVLPESQRYMVAQYFATSGGVTSIETVPPVPPLIPTVFTWFLRTTPTTIPGASSKTVFINKKPALRVGDPIMPLTYKLIPTQFNVFFGD